ncbi:glycoside hydrolase family 13 protein [Peptostreptococcus russellii]|uniref:glycoside hydrolase family 13 protein n=1 Tax=Peptostreptococcus russellii TaxID=215200 RepID=UPI00162AD900|nr:glycoside hydrolase family 13 protein [Peptostreptococcus russellii]MBC2577459.1 glycoside hydrolase family 13 protein [Peptostreptococcus russellii]
MKEIIYSPIEFNKPIGAIRNNEKKEIRILLHENFKHNSINLLLYNNTDKSDVLKFEMKKINKITDYYVYSTSIDSLQTGIYFYFFEILDDSKINIVSKVNGEAKISDHIIPWQLTVYDEEFSTPDWIKGGIMYQIFPDRFYCSPNYHAEMAVNEIERTKQDSWYNIPNSPLDTKLYSAKDFFMGNLDGIYDRLEYLKDLNIDLIYLNPIFESAENHRYSTANYFNVDPYLGNNKIFLDLCHKLKDKNIKIILDGVFNHTGSDSIYFNKESNYPEIGAYNSIKSRYYPWYNFIDYPDKYDSWWGFDNLPTINKENKDYIDFICNEENGVLNYWQKMGASGWRLDVIDELPDSFLDKIRKTVKNYDEDALLIGEVWEDASNKVAYGLNRRYLLGQQMDSVMNYPWRNAIVDFLINKDAAAFSNNISEIINNYPRPAIDTLMNLLSSHDIERIITALGVDISTVKYEDSKDFKLSSEEYNKSSELVKFASFLQFTLPGIPSIYYGDEIGMQGFKDPFNRAAFDYENIDMELLEHYKELTSFRKKFRDDFITGFKLIDFGKKHIAYLRSNILCVVNLSDKAIIIDMDKSATWIYGNKEAYMTEYGILIGPKSYTAILLNEKYHSRDSIVFKNAIDRS